MNALQNNAYFENLKRRTTQVSPSERPLSQFVEIFLSDKKAEGTSPGYRWELGRTINNFAIFLGEGLGREPKLSDFSIEAVRAFILSEQQRPRWSRHPLMKPQSKPISAQMVQNEVRMIRVFGSWLEVEEYSLDERGEPINLLRRLKLPKVEKKEIQVLTLDEETKVIKASDPRTHAGCRRLALICLFLDTGGRLSEIAKLHMEDLHLDDGYISIRWENAKGKKARSIPIGGKTERALRRYLGFFRKPSSAVAEDFVFLDIDGDPITPEAVGEIVRRLAHRTGINRLHPHLLRHTYGTRSAEGNMNTLFLQTLMGHSSSKTTEVYTHLAGVESLKRNRRLSHLDKLQFKVRRVR